MRDPQTTDDPFQGRPWLALVVCYLLLAGTHLAVAEDRTLADPWPRAQRLEPQAPAAPAPEQADTQASETDRDSPSPLAPSPKPASTGLCDGS